MRNYVVGFLFSEDRSRVALIRKEHPTWQAGKLNGIGGKEEGNETPHETMVREFEEETGVKTETEDWEHFCNIASSNNWCVSCFRSFGPAIDHVRTTTDERVIVVDSILESRGLTACARIADGSLILLPVLDSVKWLLPMALTPDIVISNVEYKENAP